MSKKDTIKAYSLHLKNRKMAYEDLLIEFSNKGLIL